MVSVAGYLAREREALQKHEYWAGQVVQVPGVSFKHGVLAVRLLTMCAVQLRDANLVALVSAMRVHASEARAFVYPDVVIVPREPRFFDELEDTITDPRAVIEVVSRSTLGHDRGAKLRAYQGIASMSQCVLVREDPVCVEHHQRRDVGWDMRELGAGQTLVMGDGIGVKLKVDSIYRWG